MLCNILLSCLLELSAILEVSLLTYKTVPFDLDFSQLQCFGTDINNGINEGSEHNLLVLRLLVDFSSQSSFALTVAKGMLCIFNFYSTCVHVVITLLLNTWINEHCFPVGDLTSLAFPGYYNVGTVEQFAGIIQFIQNHGIQLHLLSIPTSTIIALVANNILLLRDLTFRHLHSKPGNVPYSNGLHNKRIAKILKLK